MKNLLKLIGLMSKSTFFKSGAKNILLLLLKKVEQKTTI